MAKPHTQIWYLEEWFSTQGKKQHDLVKGLGWLPAKANKIWHGVQPPRLHEAAEIAELLNIRTHELLMPPEEAFRIRRLEAVIAEVPKTDRLTAEVIADDAEAPSADRKRKAS